MSLSSNLTTISNPNNFNTLFDFLSREPNATFYAGGSWLNSDQRSKMLDLGRNVINLQSIPELKKIDRTESYLVFGSCTTLSRINNLKTPTLPILLHSAIDTIASPQIRNMATIGGNLAISEYRMSLFPCLLVLNSSIELRSKTKTRWVDLRHFINEESKPDIQKGEIITKIRVPINLYNFQQYKVIGKRTNFEAPFSVLACAANIYKSTITDIQMILLDGAKTIIRPIQSIGNLNGKSLPLSPKTREELLEIFIREIKSYSENLPQETIARLIRLYKQLLSELNQTNFN